MRLPSIVPIASTRNGRVATLFLPMLGAALTFSACMGGQTGTEYAPGAGGTASPSKDSPNGSPERGNDSQATSGQSGGESSGGTSVSVPAADSGSYGGPTVAPEPACVSATSTDSGLPGTIGLTASAVEALVMRAEPLIIKYSPDSAAIAHIKLAAKASSGCFTSASNAPTALVVPVDLALVAEDSRLNLSMSGTAKAQAAADGNLSVVELSASIQCDASAEIGGLAPCAVIGLDEAKYPRVRVDFSARIQSTVGILDMLGVVNVSGSNDQLCSLEPCPTSNWTQLATFAVVFAH